MPEDHRLYGDLASWWPVISPPEDHLDEAAFAARLLASADGPVREVLELGSGGGNNAVHLSSSFTMTLVDLSARMLAVSRRLNPGCAHHLGDMRTVRLGRTFDAVFVHDAVDYLVDEADLRQAAVTAAVHCRPGGVAVFVPDHTREMFAPGTEHGGSEDPTGRGARYLAWTYDPDPGDSVVSTEYAFLLRGPDGTVEVVHETHRTGLFSRKLWLGVLADAGFVPRRVREETTDDRTPRDVFIGHRPLTT